MAGAKQTTSNAIKNCAGATVLNPDGCPQALTGDLASGLVRWAVLGDPVADASTGLGDKSDFQVTGHYLMRLTYDSAREHGTRALAVGGPYAAALKWDGQTMSVTGFGRRTGCDPDPTTVRNRRSDPRCSEVSVRFLPDSAGRLVRQLPATGGGVQRVQLRLA